MAKNVTILEGSTSKSFSSVNKLRVNNVGGGTSDWVPEDDVQLTTKHINENGTYTASDDGYYGYSEVTVSGVGNEFSYTAGEGDSIGGVDLVEGNEYEIGTDPETGDLFVNELPSYIAIETPPVKTEYYDGESVTINGIVVKAYNADGSLWEDDSHIGGVIPIAELSFSPTVIDAEEARAEEYSDGDGLNAIKITYSQSTTMDGRGNIYPVYVYVDGLGTHNGHPVTIGSTGGPATLLITKYDGEIYALRISGTNDFALFEYYAFEWASSAHWINVASTTYKTLYNVFSEGVWGDVLTNVPISTKNPLNVDVSNIHPVNISETINITWNRPSDGQVLDASFTVRVNAATENESGEVSGESGSESSSDSGSGGGHSF